MFDPPDYPYKDLSDTLREYGSDHLLFSTNCTILPSVTNLGDTSTTKLNTNERSFNHNDSGRFFTTMPITHTTGAFNTELLIIQSESIVNDPPTLLDDNTVNQFLLPIQVTSTEKKNDEESGPDLLALQSCVLCHEIFTSDADLLDHTKAYHTDNTAEQSQQLSPCNDNSRDGLLDFDPASNSVDLETKWLVCGLCDRVLSSAQEVDVTELLCCNDGSDKSKAIKRQLYEMFVCDFCNSLFASAESLDKHKNSCNIPQDQIYYYADTNANDCDVLLESFDYSQNSSICFACGKCQRQCNNAEELRSHTEVCQKCSRPKSSKHSYANSVNSKMWNCGSCNQLFATARELYRHKRGEDRPVGAPLTAYVCEECDKVLGSMCALHTHRKMHKVTKPGFPCRICGRRFNQSGHLAIHMRMHTGERPYPCDLCPKAFKVKVERDDHRRTHTGERPFACTACPKTFTAAARLREHARIHTDQRPYRCEICGAAFRRPYARTVHTLIHTGEKPHACDICGTAFRRSGDMWKHKRTIHGTQLAADDGKTC